MRSPRLITETPTSKTSGTSQKDLRRLPSQQTPRPAAKERSGKQGARTPATPATSSSARSTGREEEQRRKLKEEELARAEQEVWRKQMEEEAEKREAKQEEHRRALEEAMREAMRQTSAEQAKVRQQLEQLQLERTMEQESLKEGRWSWKGRWTGKEEHRRALEEAMRQTSAEQEKEQSQRRLQEEEEKLQQAIPDLRRRKDALERCEEEEEEHCGDDATEVTEPLASPARPKPRPAAVPALRLPPQVPAESPVLSPKEAEPVEESSSDPESESGSDTMELSKIRVDQDRDHRDRDNRDQDQRLATDRALATPRAQPKSLAVRPALQATKPRFETDLRSLPPAAWAELHARFPAQASQASTSPADTQPPQRLELAASQPASPIEEVSTTAEALQATKPRFETDMQSLPPAAWAELHARFPAQASQASASPADAQPPQRLEPAGSAEVQVSTASHSPVEEVSTAAEALQATKPRFETDVRSLPLSAWAKLHARFTAQASQASTSPADAQPSTASHSVPPVEASNDVGPLAEEEETAQFRRRLCFACSFFFCALLCLLCLLWLWLSGEACQSNTLTVLDLTSTDGDLQGFYGGFQDNTYGYLAPYRHGSGTRFGKIARFDLATLSQVRVLDLTSTDGDLKGFHGGFQDNTYGYLVPYNNNAKFGKVARFDLATFSKVTVLDLTSTDGDLKGFHGGFQDNTYGYMVPFHNGGAYFGKVARFDLATFSKVTVLDLASTDGDLKGFDDGFQDKTYGYMVPFHNGGSFFGKVARFDLATFSKVTVLDLASADGDLKGFRGGFQDNTYGYLVSHQNYDNGDCFGKVARFDLATFSKVRVLDLTSTDGDLKGFLGGFQDNTYGYLVPYTNGALFGKVARFDLATFSEVTVLDLMSTDGDLKGFRGGFQDNTYGYMVPLLGKVARFCLGTTMFATQASKEEAAKTNAPAEEAPKENAAPPPAEAADATGEVREESEGGRSEI